MHELNDAADQLAKPSHFLTAVPGPISTLLSVPPPPDPSTSTFIPSTEDPLIQQLAAEMQIEQEEEDLQEKENGVDPEIQVFFQSAVKLISTEERSDDLGGLIDENEVPTSVADLEAPPPADVEFTAAEIRSSFMGVVLQPIFLQRELQAISQVGTFLLSSNLF